MNLHSRKTKRIIAAVIAILLVIALILPLALSVSAAQTQESGSRSALTSDTGYTVRSGITLNGTDISGRRISDVKASIEQELSEKQSAVITLLGAEEGQAVTVSAGNLGLRWTNPEVIDQISGYGRGANIIARYKEQKDIEKYGANYYVETSFNEDMIRTFIERNCTAFDVKGTEPTLVRENGVFHATDGTNGMMVDVDASTADVYSYLTNEWDGRDASLDLDVDIFEPAITAADLESRIAILGTFTTNYGSSGQERSANIANGCRLINDHTVYPGQEFSVLKNITPFTEENGYYLAGSYLGDEVVESLGGGICQVSTTLYNAVIRAELKVTARSNHSMIVSYVQPSEDAAIAESANMDFRFVNTLDYPIYIEGTTYNKSITFNIYGVETRPAGRRVSFESETLETIPTEGTRVKTDPAQPVGYVKTAAGHTGYKAQLWKVVSENGVSQTREVFNQSTYNMTPMIITVGTAGTVTPELQEAIESKEASRIQTAAANAKLRMDEAAAAEAAAQAQAAQEAAQQALLEALASGEGTGAAVEASQNAADAAVETPSSEVLTAEEQP